MATSGPRDRVGLGWRPELAAGILLHLDEIDVVEVIADDYLGASSRSLRSLRTLGEQVPVALHGVSLGLASSVPVDERRLDGMARLVETVRPAFWSEHLAFVRGGGFEIGHLAAPPRTSATIEGAARNTARCADRVGVKPLVENIATLIHPPGSTHGETCWIKRVLAESNCELLLDLHNLYANAVNFGKDPLEMLDELPMDRVAAVHLAGGKWIPLDACAASTPWRLLDDHRHDVAAVTYELLLEVGKRAPRPLTVVVERDGDYPSVESLVAQVRRARETLARGRMQRAPSGLLELCQSGVRGRCGGAPEASAESPETTEEATALEAFLARLYTQEEVCRRFLSQDEHGAIPASCPTRLRKALAGIDRDGLHFAFRSFQHKRRRVARSRGLGLGGLMQRILALACQSS